MAYQTIRYEISDRILTITLNRPEQLNAFTVRMMSELVHAFGRASEDDQVRAIVVTGATIVAAGSTGDIVLNNAGNDFSSIGVATASSC